MLLSQPALKSMPNELAGSTIQLDQTLKLLLVPWSGTLYKASLLVKIVTRSVWPSHPKAKVRGADPVL